MFKLHLAGLSDAAIAKQVRCDPRTVERDIALARERIEEILADELRTVGLEAIEGLRFATRQAIEELQNDATLKAELLTARLVQPGEDELAAKERLVGVLATCEALKQKPADLLREISNASDRLAEIAGLKVRRVGGEKPGEPIRAEVKASVPDFLEFLREMVDRVDTDFIGERREDAGSGDSDPDVQ